MLRRKGNQKKYIPLKKSLEVTNLGNFFRVHSYFIIDFFNFYILSTSHYIDTGTGDPTFNPRRNLLGAISVDKEISYHLFKVEYESRNHIQMLRKSKWYPQHVPPGGDSYFYE